METDHRNKLYRQFGRIDKVPAFMYGVSHARSEVTKYLVTTPLNLHNDTYANIITIKLMLEITQPSKELRKLQTRWKSIWMDLDKPNVASAWRVYGDW